VELGLQQSWAMDSASPQRTTENNNLDVANVRQSRTNPPTIRVSDSFSEAEG
jgi:hypothetical protein